MAIKRKQAHLSSKEKKGKTQTNLLSNQFHLQNVHGGLRMHQHPIHFHNLFNTFQNLNKEEKLPRVQRHTGVGTTVTDCQYILGQILNPVYSGSGSGIARIRITGDLDVTMLQKSTVSTEQNTEKYRVLNYCTTRNTIAF